MTDGLARGRRLRKCQLHGRYECPCHEWWDDLGFFGRMAYRLDVRRVIRKMKREGKFDAD